VSEKGRGYTAKGKQRSTKARAAAAARAAAGAGAAWYRNKVRAEPTKADNGIANKGKGQRTRER
jgi:hypothetical protein